MRVLLIKTSSMGDIIHTLPALTDAQQAISDLQVDWVVEEAFAEIPSWHPLVQNVYPIALRTWRKQLLASKTRQAWQVMREQLRDHRYDIILDAQGLIKSAILMRHAQGWRVGLDWQSARESFASLFYQQKLTVNFYQHAIVRMRQLFSQALRYALPSLSNIDYGLQTRGFLSDLQGDYVVFLHGTTWATKLWPETYWHELSALVTNHGLQAVLSGGNDVEVARAQSIAANNQHVLIKPRLSISQMANLLAHAKGVVAVDTGFGHLAAALNVPTISLYGATDPAYTGALGTTSVHMASQFPCAPCLRRQCRYRQPSNVFPACYAELTPERVWKQLQKVMVKL